MQTAVFISSPEHSMTVFQKLRPVAFRQAGFVKIDEQFYRCHVSDMTITGARIHLVNPMELPSNFSLQLTRDRKIDYPCSLIWQEDSDAGVSFCD